MAADLPLSLLGASLRWRRAGDRWSVSRERQLQAPESLQVTSTAFVDGGRIPAAHAGLGVGANTSPPLEWSELPDGAAQILLIIEDVDVPLPRPLIHTIALIDVSVTGLVAGELDASDPAIRFVPAAFERVGYQGPRALRGHGEHRYGFHVYALDRAVPAEAALDGFETLLPWADGQVLAHGVLTGTQRR